MGTNGEGSDFARVRRQQNVLLAVKSKVLSLDLLLNPPKLVKLYGQVAAAVRTNASLGEAQKGLEIAAKLGEIASVDSLVLDPPSGLVLHPANAAPYGGAYVLIPVGGNFEKIHAKVRELLFAPQESATP
jgi:anionic cell wall polymer biosynthesis LytR-Cps2A-Psr (LCP) family protein